MEGLTQAVIELALALASVALAVAGGYAAAFLKEQRDKSALLKLVLTDARIEQGVQDAIRYAEELVAKEVKQRGAGVTAKLNSGAYKLSLAVARVLEKFPNISNEEAKALVHEQLSKVGAGATAAVKAVTEAVKN